MTDLVLSADNISKRLVIRSPLQMDNLKDALEAPTHVVKIGKVWTINRDFAEC
jgi:hypothetical protein